MLKEFHKAWCKHSSSEKASQSVNLSSGQGHERTVSLIHSWEVKVRDSSRCSNQWEVRSQRKREERTMCVSVFSTGMVRICPSPVRRQRYQVMLCLNVVEKNRGRI